MAVLNQAGSRRTRLTALGACVTSAALALPFLFPQPAAAAGQGFTFFPFAGYTAKAQFDGSGTELPGKITVDGATTVGLAIGTTTPQNLGVEVMWTHQWSGISYKATGAREMAVTDMAIDQFHANFLFYPPGHLNAPTKPYFLVGLGANIFNPSQEDFDSETRFAWALGAASSVRSTRRWPSGPSFATRLPT